MTLYSLMNKPFQWFIKMKIIMITSHRIQAGQTRHHLHFLILQKAASTLQLKQKVKLDKITGLYKHLNVTGNLDLVYLDRFTLTKNPKKGVTIFEFYNNNR